MSLIAISQAGIMPRSLISKLFPGITRGMINLVSFLLILFSTSIHSLSSTIWLHNSCGLIKSMAIAITAMQTRTRTSYEGYKPCSGSMQNTESMKAFLLKEKYIPRAKQPDEDSCNLMFIGDPRMAPLNTDVDAWNKTIRESCKTHEVNRLQKKID